MYWHLTFAAPERWPLCPNAASQLATLRGIGRIGPRLLLFCVVDDHAHLVLRGDRAEAARVARRIAQVLRAAAGARMQTDLREVGGRSHLYELVGYVLRQPVRHDLGVHPGAWAGSCLWDLVGARGLDGFDAHAIRRELPRLGEDRFWEEVGLHPIEALTSAAVRKLGPVEVLRGAADALVATGLDATPASVEARAVAVQLCLEADIRPRALATELDLHERSVLRLRHHVVAPERVGVACRQLSLRIQLQSASVVRPNDSERRSIERSRVLSGQRNRSNQTEVGGWAPSR